MMNGTNQYLCNFCKQPCKLTIKKYGKSRWQSCNSCPLKIDYAVNGRGKVNCIIYNCLDDKGNKYILRIDYNKGLTKIVFSEKRIYSINGKLKESYRDKSLFEVDNCLSNINPDNAFENIKAYILFS